MNLSAVLMILTAVAIAEAALAFQRPERGCDLSLMGAILLIAVALVLLDLTTAAVVAIDPPIG